MDRAAQRGLRTCLGCRERAPRADLVRLVATPDGGLQVDPHARMAGRGGYLHVRPECWQRFAAGKPYVQSLRRAVGQARRAALIQDLRAVMGERVRCTA